MIKKIKHVNVALKRIEKTPKKTGASIGAVNIIGIFTFPIYLPVFSIHCHDYCVLGSECCSDVGDLQ